MAAKVLIVMMQREKIRARVLDPSDSFEAGGGRIFETPMESIKGSFKDSMALLLEEMKEEGIDTGFKRVFLGLPGHLASLRVLTLPFTDATKAEEVLPFELGDSLLEDPDDLLFGARPMGGGRTLAVTIEKRVIETTLNSFEELHIVPEWIGLPLLYKERLLLEEHSEPSVAALVDTDSITVLKDGAVCHYSYINGPLELKFSLAVLESEGITVEHFYFTDKAAHWSEGPGGIGPLAAERVHSVSCSDDDIDLKTIAMLLGERHGPGKDTMNFRKGEFFDQRIYESARKSLRVATILICLIAIFWGANIYTRLQSSALEIDRVEDSLFSAYGSLFEGETAVDPLYQMEIKLKELRDEKEFIEGGVDVLASLKGLSRGISDGSARAGKEDVRFFELKMHEQRIVARGETASFDHADRFKDSLLALGDYKDISLTDVKKKSAGGVSFSITLTLKGDG